MEGAHSLFIYYFLFSKQKNCYSVILLGQYKNLDYKRYRHNIIWNYGIRCKQICKELRKNNNNSFVKGVFIGDFPLGLIFFSIIIF